MGTIDYKDVLAKLKKRSKKSGDKEFMDMVEGKNRCRVLPGHPNMGGFFEEVYYHSKKLNGKNVQVICFNKGDANGEQCDICTELEPLRKSKDKKDQKLYKEYKPKARFFANVLDRGDSNKSKILGMGITVLKGILGYVVDDDYGDVLDLAEGRDMIIERTGEGMDTDYEVKAHPKTSPALGDEDEIAKLIGTSAEDTKLYDLTELGQQFADEPEKALIVWIKGWEALKDEDDDESAEDKAAKSKAPAQKAAEQYGLSKKAKPAPEPDPEETEAEDEPAITSYPLLKSRCSVCGEKRHKTPAGNVCPNGHGGAPPLAEGEQPSKPSKKYLKEFPPAPVEEEEEEEEQPAPVTKKAATKAPAAKPAPADSDEDLDDLDAILQSHKKKGK